MLSIGVVSPSLERGFFLPFPVPNLPFFFFNLCRLRPLRAEKNIGGAICTFMSSSFVWWLSFCLFSSSPCSLWWVFCLRSSSLCYCKFLRFISVSVSAYTWFRDPFRHFLHKSRADRKRRAMKHAVLYMLTGVVSSQLVIMQMSTINVTSTATIVIGVIIWCWMI